MEEREKPAQVGREERGRAFIPVRRRTDSLKNCQQLRASFLPSFLPTSSRSSFSRLHLPKRNLFIYLSLSRKARSIIDRSNLSSSGLFSLESVLTQIRIRGWLEGDKKVRGGGEREGRREKQEESDYALKLFPRALKEAIIANVNRGGKGGGYV